MRGRVERTRASVVVTKKRSRPQLGFKRRVSDFVFQVESKFLTVTTSAFAGHLACRARFMHHASRLHKASNGLIPS